MAGNSNQGHGFSLNGVTFMFASSIIWAVTLASTIWYLTVSFTGLLCFEFGFAVGGKHS